MASVDAIKTIYRSESAVTFLKGSKTQNYFPVIRLDGTLQFRTDAPATAQIPEEVKITTNEVGDIDCWHERDQCVICGQGGCIPVHLNETGAHKGILFRHNLYDVTLASLSIKDFVVKVQIIDNTNYFFTAENMNTGGAGLLRWDVFSNSCYDRWEPRESGITNHFYHLRHLIDSRLLGLSIVEKNKILIFDIRDIKAPVKEVTVTTQGGAFDFYDREPEKYLLAQCYEPPAAQTTSFNCVKINYNTGQIISVTPIDDGGRAYNAPISAKPTWNHRRAAVRFIPESFMFWVSTGNSAASEKNIFLVHFQEGTKPIILPAAAGKESPSFIFSGLLATGPNKEMMDGGVSQVVVGPKIQGMYLVNARYIMKFSLKRDHNALADPAALGGTGQILCHPNCLQLVSEEADDSANSHCGGIAQDATACQPRSAGAASPLFCETSENRERNAMRCSLRREITKAPLQGTVFTAKDYFPFTFNNFTCTSPAKNFTNPRYIGAFDESNLIWFLSLGAAAIILLVLALYFILSSGSGPKYYNPNTPNLNDPYVARQLSPRNMTVPQTRQPEYYDDVPIARRNSFMIQSASMAHQQPMTPRQMQNQGYPGGTPRRMDMYNDQY